MRIRSDRTGRLHWGRGAHEQAEWRSHMVGHPVPRRAGRIFQVKRAAIMMVMTFLLPMKRRVLTLGDGIH